jgi:hypothetical protein
MDWFKDFHCSWKYDVVSLGLLIFGALCSEPLKFYDWADSLTTHSRRWDGLICVFWLFAITPRLTQEPFVPIPAMMWKKFNECHDMNSYQLSSRRTLKKCDAFPWSTTFTIINALEEQLITPQSPVSIFKKPTKHYWNSLMRRRRRPSLQWLICTAPFTSYVPGIIQLSVMTPRHSPSKQC